MSSWGYGKHYSLSSQKMVFDTLCHTVYVLNWSDYDVANWSEYSASCIFECLNEWVVEYTGKYIIYYLTTSIPAPKDMIT